MFDDCTAIVLAGGRSRRMGCDKTALPFAGQNLMQTVIDRISPLFLHTILSVRTPRAGFNDLPQICDNSTAEGPLAGLVSALAQVETPWAFVIACDMPFINPELIAALAVRREGQRAVIANPDGQWQPLAAFYATSCLPQLRAAFDSGERSLIGALRPLHPLCVDETILRRIDPDLNSFFDLDTPQDWLDAQFVSHTIHLV